MAALNTDNEIRQWLLLCYQAGLAMVNGERCVRQALAGISPERLRLIAIGKAADAMVSGAWQAAGDRIVDALVISKTGHFDNLPNDPRISAIEAGHPVPNEASLRAGALLLERLQSGQTEGHWLVLLSGGASSLVEVLPEGYGLDNLQRLNQWLLASGFDIREMNAIRQRASCIKGGKVNQFARGNLEVWAISDVSGDDPAVIGSGLFASPIPLTDTLDCPSWIMQWLDTTSRQCADTVVSPVPHRIIANLDHMLAAMARFAENDDVPVMHNTQHFSGDAEQQGKLFAQAVIKGQPGLTIWGGESTVKLPKNPGRGGRNQQLALAAATVLAGNEDCFLLALGSDGTDGPTDAAGALVDGGTLNRAEMEGWDVKTALQTANAYPCLAETGDLIVTGPTGTNVTDIVLGFKRA